MSNLAKIINVVNANYEIMEEAIPLVGEFVECCINRHIPYDAQGSFSRLLSQLLSLIDGVVFSDEITINELAQNNYEFLDIMKAVVFRLLSYSKSGVFPMLNKAHLESLLSRIDELLAELNSPPFLQHRKRTPEDATEPFTEKFIF